MFGHKNNIETLIHKGHWQKVEKLVETADANTRLQACKALENANTDEARNLLVVLLSDHDPAVQLQAARALAAIGNDNATSHLRMVFDRTPDSQSELKQALREAISATRGKK